LSPSLTFIFSLIFFVSVVCPFLVTITSCVILFFFGFVCLYIFPLCRRV
jgi:hypothetical protein